MAIQSALTYAYADGVGIRYVGKTCDRLRYRHAHHAHEARKGTRRYLYNWWRKQPVEPQPVLLGVHPTNEDAIQTEREVIALARALGEPLTNATEGGEGVLGLRHSEASRARMSAAQRMRTKQPHAGRSHTAEARERISQTKTGASPAWNKGHLCVEGDNLRRAIELRQQGWSYQRIADELPVGSYASVRTALIRSGA